MRELLVGLSDSLLVYGEKLCISAENIQIFNEWSKQIERKETFTSCERIRYWYNVVEKNAAKVANFWPNLWH